MEICSECCEGIERECPIVFFGDILEFKVIYSIVAL